MSFGATLGEIAWAASHTKGTYLSEHHKGIARRRGKKRAVVTLAHTILVMIYYIIINQLPYNELGDEYFNKVSKENLTKNIVKKLKKLGYKVQLEKIEEKKAA